MPEQTERTADPLTIPSRWKWRQPHPGHQYYRLEAGPFCAGVVERQGDNGWIASSVLTRESAMHATSVLACAAIESQLRKALS